MMTVPDDAYRAPAEPEGVRRFRLDPALHAAAMKSRLLVVGLWVALFAFLVFGAYAVATSQGATSADSTTSMPLLTTLMPMLMMGGLWGGFMIMGRKALKALNVSGYELLMTPRVLRRVSPPSRPAEILRPEVARIVETKRGLWVTSERPKRALYVASSVDGYADVRETLARWRPIEPMEGYAAWRFASKHAHLEGSRDARVGTMLESDPSLVEDLAAVRAASSDRGAGVGAVVQPVGKVTSRKTLLLWVVLIVMFLAIWQFLSPSPATPHSGRATPAARGAP